MSQRCARIPQLDGLRAISISLVIFAHLFNSAGVSLPVSWFRWQMFSGLGVRVFFVISGFLITGLLLREKEECGSISLLRFYGRRTFRILVPYYVFLAVLIVAQALHLVRFTGNDLLHALTYTTNYQTDRSWVTGHCWSLAVEEQFYLLWPLAMVLLGKRRAALAALGMLFLAPVMRSFIWKFVPAMHPVLGISFETVADALAAGCLLACAREKLWTRTGYRALLSSRWMLLVPPAVMGISLFDAFPSISYTVGYSLMNLGVALIIDWTLRFPQKWTARALSLRPLVYVGSISYSLYLWQQPFLEHVDLQGLPLNLVAALAVAVLAHYAVERPSLALRVRVEEWARSQFPQLRRRSRIAMPVPAEQARAAA
ncbi:MAG: acyltransferase [Deltaproteobacteria bacterium]|nr:MAG: acyltransferase [Deltaproteobacteria bacterium]